jgi:hypothetical protein
MSTRALCTLLAILAFGAVALVAQESGAIRTNITTTTPPTPSATPSTKVWTALVLATNADNSKAPSPAPVELREFVPKMKKVFGYNQFQLIGSSSKEIGDRTPSRMEPSKSFWMTLTSRRTLSKEAQGGALLSVQLNRDDRSILESEVKLAPDSPLFIRGPQYGNGQLIIVLKVER